MARIVRFESLPEPLRRKLYKADITTIGQLREWMKPLRRPDGSKVDMPALQAQPGFGRKTIAAVRAALSQETP